MHSSHHPHALGSPFPMHWVIIVRRMMPLPVSDVMQWTTTFYHMDEMRWFILSVCLCLTGTCLSEFSAWLERVRASEWTFYQYGWNEMRPLVGSAWKLAVCFPHVIIDNFATVQQSTCLLLPNRLLLLSVALCLGSMHIWIFVDCNCYKHTLNLSLLCYPVVRITRPATKIAYQLHKTDCA